MESKLSPFLPRRSYRSRRLLAEQFLCQRLPSVSFCANCTGPLAQRRGGRTAHASSTATASTDAPGATRQRAASAATTTA